MTHPATAADRLLREAERCERIAAGVSDAALLASLRGWAEEYRRQAETLLDYRQAA